MVSNFGEIIDRDKDGKVSKKDIEELLKSYNFDEKTM